MYKTLVVGTDGSPTADKAVAGGGGAGPLVGLGTAHRDGLPHTPFGHGRRDRRRPGRQWRGPGPGRGGARGGGPVHHREVRGGHRSRGARAAGQRRRRDPHDGGRGGGGPDRRREQGHAAPPLSRQRAELRWRTVRTAPCWWSRRTRSPDRAGRFRRTVAGGLAQCARAEELLRRGRSPRPTTRTRRPGSIRTSSGRRWTSWRRSPATGPPWSWASAPVASRCRCRAVACRCGASTCRPTWWRN